MVAHRAFSRVRIAGGNGFKNGMMLGEHAPRTPGCTEASALAFDQQVIGDTEHCLEHAVARGPRDGFMEIPVGQHHRGQIVLLDAPFEFNERRRKGTQVVLVGAACRSRRGQRFDCEAGLEEFFDTVVIQGFPTGERLLVRR